MSKVFNKLSNKIDFNLDKYQHTNKMDKYYVV